MSENVFALWKRRFPIINVLRFNINHSQDTVVATAVLHNMGLLWKDEFVGDHHNDRDDQDQDDFIVIEDPANNPAERRYRGQVLRDILLERMPE